MGDISTIHINTLAQIRAASLTAFLSADLRKLSVSANASTM